MPIVFDLIKYDNPVIGMTNIIVMNEFMYCGESINNSHIYLNQVINHEIDFWGNTYNHNRRM